MPLETVSLNGGGGRAWARRLTMGASVRVLSVDDKHSLLVFVFEMF